MKIKKDSGEFKKIEVNMTPMIDACFLLIIFFILTLKLFSPEGDFGITMPLASPRQGLRPIPEVPPVKVRLTAHPDGELVGIQMGQRNMSSFAELHKQVHELAGLDRGPSGSSNTEVELDCDYNLKFKYVVDTLNAISGYVANDKQTIIRMIEKIRFAPPREPKEEEGGEKGEKGGEKKGVGGGEREEGSETKDNV